MVQTTFNFINEKILDAVINKNARYDKEFDKPLTKRI